MGTFNHGFSSEVKRLAQNALAEIRQEMSAELIQHLETLARDGVKIHIWPCAAGFQANISEPGSSGWTCHTEANVIDALLGALRRRVSRVPDRRVEYDDGDQVDLEEYIAAAPAGFEDLL